MSLRTGITTGSCAAAAAKAAACLLWQGRTPTSVEIDLPAGQVIQVPVLYARLAEDRKSAMAAVRKDGGDDPDATHGLEIVAAVQMADGGDIIFRAGEGVGMVTKPGLQVPPGEPAINPVPRSMIRRAVRQITDEPVCVEVSIPGGREVAAKTFNPRLGIEGGLSILGTTGIVRPYSNKALRDALKCSMDVAAACGVDRPVLVPGNIGAKAARKHFALRDEQVIEVSNEWGFMLDQVRCRPFKAVMALGHPGKLAKLETGQWDTHSSRSDGAVKQVAALAQQVLKRTIETSPTVEGIFAAMEESERIDVANALAGRVRQAVAERIGGGMEVAVVLVNMQGEKLGSDGELSPWR